MTPTENLPTTYGIDECEILWRTPHSLFVWWELTDGGLATARQGLGSSGANARRVMRLFIKHPVTGDRSHVDSDVTWNEGQTLLTIPLALSTVRVGIGLLSPEGYFASIVHSSVVHMPPDRPADELATRWAELALDSTSSRRGLVLRDAMAAAPRTEVSLSPSLQHAPSSCYDPPSSHTRPALPVEKSHHGE